LTKKNNGSVLALVDMGASLTIISDSALKTICPNRVLLLKPYTDTVKAVNGTPIEVLGTIEISFDNIKSLHCLVVPDFRHEFIVGIDSLKKGNAEIDITNESMTWFDKHFKLIPYSVPTKRIGACAETVKHNIVSESLLSKYDEIFGGNSMPEPLKQLLLVT
jgi:hypothetical protein